MRLTAIEVTVLSFTIDPARRIVIFFAASQIKRIWFCKREGLEQTFLPGSDPASLLFFYI
jgi:hypothetical protein